MRRAVIFLSLFVLAGCASQQPYVEPTGISTASIRFLNATQDGPVFPAIYKEAATCRGRLKIPELPEGGESSVRVAAGQLVSATLLWAGRNSRLYCPMTWSFVPEPNASYRASIEVVGSQCYIRLLDVTDAFRVRQLKEYRQRDWRRAWDEAGEWCN